MADGAYNMVWDNSTSSWVKSTSAARGSEQALSVQIVDASGNQITSFGGGSGSGVSVTQYTEDAASAGGETGTMLLAVRNDTAAAKTSTDGDFSAIAVDSAGRVGISDLGGSITVDGTFWQATQPVSIAAAVAVTDNSSSLTVDAPVGTPVFVRLSDGASAISTLPVSLASVPSHAVTNAGTFAVQVDGAALTALQLLDDTIFTDDSAFTIATSKVNMAGGYAVAHGANPDAADAGDAGAILMNRHRIPFTIGGHPNIVARTAYVTTAQTDASIVGTINAGTRIVLTAACVALDAGTTLTSGVAVKLGFGATTIPADSSTGANGIVLDHKGIYPGGGVALGNGGGIIGIGGDGEELRLTCEAPTGGGISVTINYFTIES